VTRVLSKQRRRLGSTFLWWAFLAGIAIAGFLVILGVQVNRGFRETQALRAEVIRSYEDRAQLQRLLSLHQDLETGQRGYNLTADPMFLGPYEDANHRINASFALLESRWRENPQNLAALAEIRRLSREKRQFAERSIAASGRGNTPAVRTLIAEGEGRRLMDGIRQHIAAIDLREREQLAQRTSVAEAARATLQRRMVLLQLLLVLVLAVALILLVRAYRGWQLSFDRERNLLARQEAIFDAARDGMVVLNPSGSIESLNPATARLFGYEAAELVRRDVGLLFEIAPDRGLVETFLKRLAARHEAGPGDVQDFVGRRKDGTTFPAAVTVSPVNLVDGVRFLAIIRDVTERIAIDRMKSEFVSTVSHELRTPLTSIAGSLGLIAGGATGVLPERAQRLVEIAQSNCARLIRLINDILDIEKIEAGKVRFQIAALPLGHLLGQIIEANREFAEAQQVTIELGPVPADATILGDADRVVQVFTNLLSNAAKFSPEGSVVRVSVAPLDRRYRISVSDDGPGISDEFRERIFTRFAQADASDTRARGGTGLGLSIVREIVQRLGGEVGFESTPGHGATFHVDLPAARASVEDPGKAELLGRISDAELPLILHVDDDPDMLRIIAQAFDGRAQVHSSPSVLEARAAIARYAFDAVILDIAMADGDGLELIPLIRQRAETAIAVFTAQDAEPSRLAGVDLVLVKSRDSLDRLVGEAERLARHSREGRA
jgi:PAS domain S-box-containing protein